MNKICFDSNKFLYSTSFMVTIFITIIIATLIYIRNGEETRFEKYCKEKLHTIQSTIQTNIPTLPSVLRVQKEQGTEYYPDRRYTGQNDYELSSNAAGYIYNNTGRYPLYVNRRDRNYYYHVIDDTRNNIRIPLDNPKNEELYDGASIQIPELNGTYTVKLYEYAGNRYNPYV